MTEKPVPPLWLSSTAALAFSRIVDRLWQRGEWRDELSPMAEVAARACAIYARKAHVAVPPGDLEEWRKEARAALVSMGWFTESRGRLGVIDSRGNDADLIALTKDISSP